MRTAGSVVDATVSGDDIQQSIEGALVQGAVLQPGLLHEQGVPLRVRAEGSADLGFDILWLRCPEGVGIDRRRLAAAGDKRSDAGTGESQDEQDNERYREGA